jgi:hypothetical protein
MPKVLAKKKKHHLSLMVQGKNAEIYKIIKNKSHETQTILALGTKIRKCFSLCQQSQILMRRILKNFMNFIKNKKHPKRCQF